MLYMWPLYKYTPLIYTYNYFGPNDNSLKAYALLYEGEGVLPCHTGRLSCSKNIWPLEPWFPFLALESCKQPSTAENCHTSYLKAKEHWGATGPVVRILVL